MSVTSNLSTALHVLRDASVPRTLWVDAVCINQNDLAEKSCQVPLMGFICRRCESCVVWLGESDEESGKAFVLLRKEVVNEYLRILTRVLHRQRLTRIWIIQEVLLAPKVFVCCGKDTVEWEQLAAVVALVRPLGSTVNPTPVGGEYKHFHPAYYPRILDYTRRRMEEGMPFDLHQALRSFQPFDATLPVDKVFGILSLLVDPTNVQVDCTLSPREVYQKVALVTLEYSKCLDLFLDCISNANGSQMTDLPSWAPDWSATNQPLDNPVETVTAEEFSQASCGTKLDYDINHHDGVLILRGHIFGRLLDLGDPIPSLLELRRKYWPVGQWSPSTKFFDCIEEVLAILDFWKHAISRRSNGAVVPLSSSYVTGETL